MSWRWVRPANQSGEVELKTANWRSHVRHIYSSEDAICSSNSCVLSNSSSILFFCFNCLHILYNTVHTTKADFITYLLLGPHQNTNPPSMSQQQQQQHLKSSKEAQIQNALHAIKQDAESTQRRAATIYSVSLSTEVSRTFLSSWLSVLARDQILQALDSG